MAMLRAASIINGLRAIGADLAFTDRGLDWLGVTLAEARTIDPRITLKGL